MDKNDIAYNILRMLVSPFTSLHAYKTGVIDANGNVQIQKSSWTQEQRDSYNAVTRLVIKLKQYLNELPPSVGVANGLTAALFLINEQQVVGRLEDADIQTSFRKVVSAIGSGMIPVDERLTVESFMNEDESPAPNNVTSGAAVNIPTTKPRKRDIQSEDL